MDPYGDGSVRMTQTVSLHTHTRQIPYLLRSVVCVVVTLQQMKSDGELYVAVRKTVCVCVTDSLQTLSIGDRFSRAAWSIAHVTV